MSRILHRVSTKGFQAYKLAPLGFNVRPRLPDVALYASISNSCQHVVNSCLLRSARGVRRARSRLAAIQGLTTC
jgi:hypothetical protein